jgi:hypothetical protein
MSGSRSFAQASDTGGMERVREIGGADFLEGSRPGGGLLRTAPTNRWLSLAALLHDFAAFRRAAYPGGLVRRASSAPAPKQRTNTIDQRNDPKTSDKASHDNGRFEGAGLGKGS